MRGHGGVRMIAMVRRLAKAGAETILTIPPALALLKQRLRGKVVVLAYHNVIPDHEPLTGGHGAHIRLKDFQWQMDLVEDLCEIVPLESVLEPPEDPTTYRAAITFDDAYVGTLREALPELVKRRLPATVFVPSGLVGQGAFWWDDLGISGWQGERYPLVALRGNTEEIRRWATSIGIVARDQGPSQVAAAEDLILASKDLPGVTFGVHTARHLNLSQLSAVEITREVGECYSWIQDRGLSTSRWVSYPYGLTSRRVEHVLRSQGFSGGLIITGGLFTPPGGNAFQTPRLLIPAGLSRKNFMLRLVGLISS